MFLSGCGQRKHGGINCVAKLAGELVDTQGAGDPLKCTRSL